MTEDNRRAAPGRVMDTGGIVLILGAARSGTSWLGKIFDSHPAVIYRHEPDSVLRPIDFPRTCPIEEIPQYVDAARRYVVQLTAVRQVKTSGTRPVFAKPFQPFAAPLIRRALALGLRLSESVLPRAAWPKQIAIPDFIHADAADITYVIKSINLLPDAALLATALPASRFIALVRHPCGQIASFQRGLAAGFMQSELSARGFWTTPRARELGLTREWFEALPIFERRVWSWALLHAKLFEEASRFSNLLLLRYEDLCRNPVEQARAVLAFANLPWTEETNRFIEMSTHGNGREQYYTLFRDPLEAATKWQHELTPAEIDQVMTIVDQVLPGRFSID